MNKTPVEIFISYAHEDERLLEKLKLHLAYLHGQGLITLWHDRDISAGTEWATKIDIHLNTAQIILLLVSPAFFASTYCTNIELQRALDRHEAHEARVIPIILHPVTWKEARFGKLQALPTGARAVTGLTWRFAGEAILKRNLQAIGIQFDIQNYPGLPFFSLLAKGEASPPTGAVAGRYDIAELANSPGYDPDDSSFLSCAYGPNIEFYCNPALETLYQQELGTLDAGQRQQIFNQIHAIYLTDFPFVTLYSPPIIYIVHKGTHNYQPSPLGFEDPNIWEWWCDRGTC